MLLTLCLFFFAPLRETPRPGLYSSCPKHSPKEQKSIATRQSLRPALVWILLCCIWGSTWAFIKLGLRDLPPLTFAGIRFVIAVGLLVCIAYFRRARLPRNLEEWRMLAATGVLQFAINYGLIFWGEKYISSGLAALLQATIPLFGLLIAHAYLPAEPLTFARVCGVVLGLVGVCVIFSDQLGLGDVWAVWGSAAIIVGAFAAAYSNVLVKARGAKVDLSVMVAVQMCCGLVPLLIIALIKEGNPLAVRWTLAAIVSVVYLALVGSVAAFMLYYWLVRNMDVTTTQLIALVTPVAAVIIGVIFLDERLNWRIALGGLLIFTGIGIIILRRRRKTARDVPETVNG
ncbi:MAG TPA: EamA family transporter [Pyrinomonadaceae bacterium]|jgi:drug/metabolite transporter (DMT)-like permease